MQAQVGGSSCAVVKDQPGSGIYFAPDGLHVPLAPGNERAAKCKLGPFFARLPGGGKALFAPDEKAATTLVGLRAYVAAGGPEQWELDGIVWKSSKQ